MNPDWRKLLSGAGIRGSESDLTDEFAARFGFACAQWLAEMLEAPFRRGHSRTHGGGLRYSGLRHVRRAGPF